MTPGFSECWIRPRRFPLATTETSVCSDWVSLLSSSVGVRTGLDSTRRRAISPASRLRAAPMNAITPQKKSRFAPLGSRGAADGGPSAPASAFGSSIALRA